MTGGKAAQGKAAQGMAVEGAAGAPAGAEPPERPGGIQVIARAAAVLRLLGDHPRGLSLAAMAAPLGLARSTVQRIVQALEAEGFVEPSGPGGGFRLGPSLADLVYRRQVDIVSEARPFLEEACAALDETVALYALTGARIAAIDRCIAERPLRVVFPLGAIPHPAHLLAPGRAILAALPRERAARLLGAELEPAALAPVLDALDADGEEVDDCGAFIPDLCGFAIPLRTHFGLFSLAAILPVTRLHGRREAIFTALRAARDGIEAKIGEAPGRG